MRPQARTLPAALLALVTFAATSAAADALAFEGAWVRFVPGGAPMAGYVTIVNAADAPRRLVGARSKAFARATLHRSIVKGGRSRMTPVAAVELPPSERVALEPGGRHLMLMDATRPLQPGDTITIELLLDDGARHRVTFEVKPIGAGA